MECNEKENKNLINKYHKIYVDINGDYTKEVERWIVYSMTGDTFFNTNFLLNLGQSAANGKSTVLHRYQKVLPIYWNEINPYSFNFKNKNDQESLFKYQTATHLFCN